ncbi:T170A protein, partial [Scytalopus superciliaris]|nr:T170A protein [Scytalopus superciliaris]
LLQQILSLRLVPRVGNGTTTYSSPLSTFPGTSPRPRLPGPGPAGAGPTLTALLPPEMCVLLMGIVGPITAGTLTSAAFAGVYRAAGKKMIPFEALIFGVGQTFCVVVVSFLRILATL